MDSNNQLPILKPSEIRVLGSLLEKSKTTPDYYPMTLHALTAACNQKTSRFPIVNYNEEIVLDALNSLKKMGLVATATGGTSRTIKYKHNYELVFTHTAAEYAVLCLLLLRGPLTAGEINSNSARIFEFESLSEVLSVLEKLTDANLVKQLPKKAGQKEARYVHLLGEVVDLPSEEQATESVTKSTTELEERLLIVEHELANLKNEFEKLVKELKG